MAVNNQAAAAAKRVVTLPAHLSHLHVDLDDEDMEVEVSKYLNGSPHYGADDVIKAFFPWSEMVHIRDKESLCFPSDYLKISDRYFDVA